MVLLVQGCPGGGLTGQMVSQWCHNGATMVSQWCYNGVIMV
jgi:hypothetical protein